MANVETVGKNADMTCKLDMMLKKVGTEASLAACRTRLANLCKGRKKPKEASNLINFLKTGKGYAEEARQLDHGEPGPALQEPKDEEERRRDSVIPNERAPVALAPFAQAVHSIDDMKYLCSHMVCL